MESIAPGHHLYAGPDGTWRSCDPRERFARLSGPADLLERMRDQAYGGGADPELEPLAAVLRERGVLASARREPARRIAVRVTGEGPVAAEVARLFEAAPGVLVRHAPTDADDATATDTAADAGATADTADDATAAEAGNEVLVACAGWLTDERWRRLDASGRVWHRCHVEGTRLVLGPMTVPGVTASYRDLRGRRLAASPLPDELAALWAVLDDGAAGRAPLPPLRWPNAGAVCLAAGLLVNDVLTWRDTGLPATGSSQLVVDPATGTVDRHPVLPLPVA